MRTTMAIALVSGALVLAGNASAADNNASTSGASVPAPSSSAAHKDTESESFGALYDLASQMLGHAAMAKDALTYGLYSAASDNIDMAQKEASDLAAKTPQFNSTYSSKSAGKNNNATDHADYMFPVMDNVAAVQEMNGKHLASSNPKVDVADAEAVNYLLFIDTKQASDALNQAQSDMKQDKYSDVMAALQKINNGDMVEATAYDTPLEAVRDNLRLAREMVRNKQYKSASYALNHAKYELKRAEKADTQLANSKDAKDLQEKINEMQTTIAQDNPSLLQKAEAKIDEWVQIVESHLHKKS